MPVADNVATASVVVKVPWTDTTPIPDKVAVPRVTFRLPLAPLTTTVPPPKSSNMALFSTPIAPYPPVR